MKLEQLLTIDFIQEINKIARQAGEQIMLIYQRDFKVENKSDSSPLTEADLAAHNTIIEALSELTPNIPVLSEESVKVDWQQRKEWNTYWLIDPLDGTKEFIKRNGEFTVNIALIHQHQPVLGVVYAPVPQALYFASESIQSWKQTQDEQAVKIDCGGVPKSSSPIRIVGSRSHQSDSMLQYLEQFEDYELIPMGSSLKICLIAEGKADLYPRLGPTSEWDTAAAHAVLKYAGGTCKVYDSEQELLYNNKDSLLNPNFIAKGY